MNLISYLPKGALKCGTNLKRQINLRVERLENQNSQRVKSIKTRLKQISIYTRHIFIFLADSIQHLKELISLNDWLEGRRVLLILPDDSKETLSLAIFSKYFTYINDTYEDLCAVIFKMVNNEVIGNEFDNQGGHEK